jgi:hypothetical protein
MCQEPLTKLEEGFLKASAHFGSIPTDPASWAEPSYRYVAPLSASAMAELDEQLGVYGIGTLRAKAAFAHRFCLWVAARDDVLALWKGDAAMQGESFLQV